MPSLPTKSSVRRHFRDLRNAVAPSDRAAWDTALCEALLRHEWVREADVIFGFYPVNGEPDLRAFYEAVLAAGKTLAFPISHKESRTMVFCAVDTLSDLIPGAYGIPAPGHEHSLVAFTEHTLCLVPGLAFDREGYRLGYGGGYYDRFLAKFSGHTLAPTYTVLYTDSLPREDTDLPVGQVLTELD